MLVTRKAQPCKMQGETLLRKNTFFKKANIVRKMDFYKDKSLFLCQYQLLIVPLCQQKTRKEFRLCVQLR